MTYRLYRFPAVVLASSGPFLAFLRVKTSPNPVERRSKAVELKAATPPFTVQETCVRVNACGAFSVALACIAPKSLEIESNADT